jgi:hypothetical protein
VNRSFNKKVIAVAPNRVEYPSRFDKGGIFFMCVFKEPCMQPSVLDRS